MLIKEAFDGAWDSLLNLRGDSYNAFLAKCLEKGKLENLSDWMTSDLDLQAVMKKLGR